MMLKQGDFVRIEYAGYNKDGVIFDSTHGEIAKKMHEKEGPILIVYGKGQLIKGIEEEIKDMDSGEEKEITVQPEKGFGKRKKELLNIMREEEFRKHNVAPTPGSLIHVDFGENRLMGYVKSANSGRVLVDFNHPLAGQVLRYKIKIIEILTSIGQKLNSLIKESGLDCTYEITNNKLTLNFKSYDSASLTKPKDAKEDFEQNKTRLANSIKFFIPEIKEIVIEK